METQIGHLTTSQQIGTEEKIGTEENAIGHLAPNCMVQRNKSKPKEKITKIQNKSDAKCKPKQQRN